MNKLLSKKPVQIRHLGQSKTSAQYVSDRRAPLKEKHVGCNQAPLVN